jgi:hypothetical protein
MAGQQRKVLAQNAALKCFGLVRVKYIDKPEIIEAGYLKNAQLLVCELYIMTFVQPFRGALRWGTSIIAIRAGELTLLGNFYDPCCPSG